MTGSGAQRRIYVDRELCNVRGCTRVVVVGSVKALGRREDRGTEWAVSAGNTVPPFLVAHSLGPQRTYPIAFHTTLSSQQSVYKVGFFCFNSSNQIKLRL